MTGSPWLICCPFSLWRKIKRSAVSNCEPWFLSSRKQPWTKEATCYCKTRTLIFCRRLNGVYVDYALTWSPQFARIASLVKRWRALEENQPIARLLCLRKNSKMADGKCCFIARKVSIILAKVSLLFTRYLQWHRGKNEPISSLPTILSIHKGHV